MFESNYRKYCEKKTTVCAARENKLVIVLCTVCSALVLAWYVSAGGEESVPGFSPSWPDVLYCRESETTDRQSSGAYYCVFVFVCVCFRAFVHLQT